MNQVDVLIIGAGAAGLLCAVEAGKRGRRVLVVDHGPAPGRKILVTGGGRCNFSNRHIDASHYLSHNPHFCKSALSRFTQQDFLDLVQRHGISYHERNHGQLFCDTSAREILDMLLREAGQAGVTLRLQASITGIKRLAAGGFQVASSQGDFVCHSLVVATGGLSLPTIGASPFGYKIAEQFGIKVWPPSAGLVPFTLQPADKARLAPLAGISVDTLVSTARQSFRENLLFTHRGLSGPAILQLSSYWRPGEEVVINLLPDLDLVEGLRDFSSQHPQRQLKAMLTELLPKRLVTTMVPAAFLDRQIKTLSRQEVQEIAAALQCWTIVPNGTEGYRTAEVTLGGVDCAAISSKTMASHKVAGLYFIGEVLDVSGWLGGYNLQWAWSSAWCAGQYA
jgi:predicted Rossmann fold flavoprotein